MDDTTRITNLQMKVAELERKLDFVMKHLDLEYHEDPLSPVLAEVVALIRQGNRLEAINLYREKTGVNLKAAKDAVEELAGRLGAG